MVIRDSPVVVRRTMHDSLADIFVRLVTVRVSDRPFEGHKFRGERDCAPVRLELIEEERVLHVTEPFWSIDADRRSAEDDRRGSGTTSLRPVPVRLTKVQRGLPPLVFLGRVLLSELKSVLLDELLWWWGQHEDRVPSGQLKLAYLEESNIRSVPGREERRSMSTVRPSSTLSLVPGDERNTVEPCNLVERQ